MYLWARQFPLNFGSLLLLLRGMESESWFWHGVGVSFEEDSDSGLYLSHLDFCVILLQSI